MGKSLKAFSREGRSVISGSAGFFLRAFSYAGDCSARRALFTVPLSVSCQPKQCQKYRPQTSEHVLALAVQNTGTKLEVLAPQEIGHGNGDRVGRSWSDGLRLAGGTTLHLLRRALLLSLRLSLALLLAWLLRSTCLLLLLLPCEHLGAHCLLLLLHALDELGDGQAGFLGFLGDSLVHLLLELADNCHLLRGGRHTRLQRRHSWWHGRHRNGSRRRHATWWRPIGILHRGRFDVCV